MVIASDIITIKGITIAEGIAIIKDVIVGN